MTREALIVRLLQIACPVCVLCTAPQIVCALRDGSVRSMLTAALAVVGLGLMGAGLVALQRHARVAAVVFYGVATVAFAAWSLTGYGWM